MKKLARKGLALGLSFLMFASTAYSDLSLIAHAEETHHVWTKVSLNDISENDSIAITMTSVDGKTTYVLPNTKATNAGPKAKIGTVDGNTLVMNEGDDASYVWHITKNTVKKTVVDNAVNNTEADVEVLDNVKTNDTEDDSSKNTTEGNKVEGQNEDDNKSDDAVVDTPIVDTPMVKADKEADVKKDDLQVDEKTEKKESENTVTYYTISTDDSDYLHTNAANNGVRVDAMPKDQVGAQWVISGNYLSATDSKNTVRYLGVYNGQDWRAYDNTERNIKGQTVGFYKLTSKVAGAASVAAPKASVESGAAVDFGTKVELSTTTEDAKIYYNTDGSGNFKLYDSEAPIEITGNTTIKAYAEKDGNKSEETTPLTYTLAEGTKITDLTKLSAEQEFVIAFNNELAMTSTAEKGKLKTYKVKLNDDKHLTVDDESAALAKLKLVKTEKDGEFYITSDILEGETLITKYLSVEVKEKGCDLLFVNEVNENCTWVLEVQEDGAFLLKNAKATFKEKPQYLEYYNAFAAYGFNDKNKDIYTFNAYTFPKVEKPVDVPTENTIGTLLKRELYPDDKVVFYFAKNKKVMTSTPKGTGLEGVTAELSEDGKLDVGGKNALVLTAKFTTDNELYFKTAEDKYLSVKVETTTYQDENGKDKTSTKAYLILVDELDENSYWTQSKIDGAEDGSYHLTNKVAKAYGKLQQLEYYEKNGFTVYSFQDTSADSYVMSFYALEQGEKPVKFDYDKDTLLTIAQWAGNAHYDEVETAKEYINGDSYATNDMLDKNAKFTAVVNGAVSKPWTSAKSTTTGSTSYYMGSTGVAKSETDYMQFTFPSTGYGNMSLEFRMRASKTGAGAFQLQYSTDGEKFKNFKTGTYSFKYTGYKDSGKVDENGKAVQEPFEVNGKGDITDGIAKTSLAPTYYVTFNFNIPNGAANAEKLYVRFVPTGLNANGDKAPSNAGVIRIDGVMVKGNPIISSELTRHVTVSPAEGEIAADEKITLSSATEGADIFYSINGGEFVKYDAEEKVSFEKLPATISTYATKEGLAKSITVNYKFTQAQVLSVKATPNGGAIASTQKVTLKTKTEGATILYRYMTEEEIKKAEEKKTQTETKTENKDENKTDSEEESDDADPEPTTEEKHDDWITYEGAFELKELPAQIQVKAVKEGYLDSAVKTLKFTKRVNDKYGIYFGQIHAHTSISDGAGTLEEALQHASKVDNLDYIVITDHSNSIDNEKDSKITENVDKSENDEWTYAHNLVKQYTTDKFTCAYGYEMTWSNGLGHMNTFNTPGFQSRTQSAFGTYATALDNYYAALRTVPDSISQFNHPGTTFGDFQDFAYYSEENDNLITMIEVGNGEGTIGSSGYFPSYEYYTRALDKGWHVAPTNNQDNHKGKWGDANTARTVMLADVNNEDAIYDAMRNYRIYATEDNDLSIYYTLNDNIMGTILEKEDVGDTVELKAEIKDPTDSKIGKVEVIVNGGMSIASQNVDKSEATVTFEVPSSYSYYYLKITEADKDIAVTAPVWVGKVEACGINKTYTNTVLPVKDEDIDINVDFYNNEKADLTINEIEIVVKDVDGKETPVVKVSGEEANVATVKSLGTATYKTNFKYTEPGKVTYEVKVNASLNGVNKVYNDKLSIDYANPEMVSDVIVDGTHYNDYVTGYYGGNMSAFTQLAAKQYVRVTVEKNEITADMLKNCKLLVLAAPAKKNGTANAGDYKVSHYSDEFLTMVKEYVANGGSVIVCGLADYSDSVDCQTATEQNKLLEAIGSTIRMGSDEICDDTNNGGQVYRMYPTNVNLESDLLAGFREGQKYSQYSGCSVDISNATATEFVEEAEWLVKGFDTTYSVDCKDEKGKAIDGSLENGVKGKKNDNDGKVTFLARQKTKAGGQIIVSGGVFVSDFEVKVEMDNNDTLPFVNYTIASNVIAGSKAELKTSTIAQARAGKKNEVFAVEGYVTSGTDNDKTTFFDTIYIQDETGGIDIFPYATPGLAIGTKMRIVGYVSEYQGDKELKVISSQILDAEPYVWDAKVVNTKDAMDYDKFGGSLLKTTGKVTRVKMADDGKTVEEFWIQDGTGAEAAIFIDGYIYSATTGKNELASFVKEGEIISAAGILYMHPEGNSDVSVPVFRVRNCDDIQLGKEEDVMPGEEVPTPQPSETPSTQPTVVEKIVQGITNFVSSVVKAIQESPIVNALKNLFGLGTTNTNTNTNTNNNKPTRTAAANVVPEEAPAEETPAVEATPEAPASEEVIADEETPLAAVAENNTTEKSFPVVPVTAGSVIILAGAALAISKASAAAAATATAGKSAGLLAKLISLFRK